MVVFGLTGGIGSGKSTVAERFVERGLPVVNADQLAREVVAPGSAGLQAVVEVFGMEILDASGALDRAALARVVFADPERRARLNALTHPLIRQLADQRFDEYEASGERLACYEVPLLFEVGLQEKLRPVVVVSVPKALQVARTMARDGMTEGDAWDRINAQMPLREKTDRADYVIDNSGSIEEARFRTDEVLDAICSEVGLESRRYPLPPFSRGAARMTS